MTRSSGRSGRLRRQARRGSSPVKRQVLRVWRCFAWSGRVPAVPESSRLVARRGEARRPQALPSWDRGGGDARAGPTRSCAAPPAALLRERRAPGRGGPAREEKPGARETAAAGSMPTRAPRGRSPGLAWPCRRRGLGPGKGPAPPVLPPGCGLEAPRFSRSRPAE